MPVYNRNRVDVRWGRYSYYPQAINCNVGINKQPITHYRGCIVPQASSAYIPAISFNLVAYPTSARFAQSHFLVCLKQRRLYFFKFLLNVKKPALKNRLSKNFSTKKPSRYPSPLPSPLSPPADRIVFSMPLFFEPSGYVVYPALQCAAPVG